MHNNQKKEVDSLGEEQSSEAPLQSVETQGKDETAQYKEKWLRAEAELENVRKRAAKEREDALKYGITKFAQDILTFSDNIARALKSCPSDIPQEFQGLIEGIKLIEGEVKTIFDRYSIKEVNPLGEVFDPHFHQAMFEIAAQEGQASGIVAQVVQVGYTLHDRLLRPALVGVIKG